MIGGGLVEGCTVVMIVRIMIVAGIRFVVVFNGPQFLRFDLHPPMEGVVGVSERGWINRYVGVGGQFLDIGDGAEPVPILSAKGGVQHFHLAFATLSFCAQHLALAALNSCST